MPETTRRSQQGSNEPHKPVDKHEQSKSLESPELDKHLKQPTEPGAKHQSPRARPLP